MTTRPLAFLAATLLPHLLLAQTTLHFPPDRPVGILWTRDASPPSHPWEYSFQGWQRLADARGNVTVPPNQQVRLDVAADAAPDLSFLQSLAPADLHFLQLASAPLGPSRLRDLAHLTQLKTLYLTGTKLQNDDLAPLAALTSVDELRLGSTGITDPALQHLLPLKSLRTLSAWQENLTDAAAKTLADIPSLEEIRLNGDDITDAGAAHLATLPHLQTLDLSDTHVADAGLTALGRSPSLRSLDLMNVPTTPAGLEGLSSAKLESLRLDGKYPVDNAGLRSLGKIPTLERLLLPQGSTPKGLRSLLPLEHLQYLSLSQDTDDQGLATLADLPSLSELTVTGAGITDVGVAKLAASLKLKALDLSYTNATASSVKLLASIPTLESLSLYSNDHVDLASLKHLPRLKRLYLTTNRVGPDAAAAIGHMPQLEHLQLWTKGLTDPELTSIAGAKSLKFAQFNNDGSAGKFTDAGVAALARAPVLENLTLWTGDLTDQSLASLATIPNLQYLQAAGHFTDAGLASLEAMPALHFLNLTGTFAPRSLDRLKQRTPSLQVISASTSTPKPVQRAKVGDPCPDFDLVTLDGAKISSKQLRGHPVVLYFWATWCAPCVAWTPHLIKLQQELAPTGAQWISLSLDDMDHQPKRYAQQHHIPWPQVRLGLNSPLADSLGITGVPTIVILNPAGQITATNLRSESSIRQSLSPTP